MLLKIPICDHVVVMIIIMAGLNTLLGCLSVWESYTNMSINMGLLSLCFM